MSEPREFWISEDECLPTFFYSPKDFTDYYTQMIELQARLDMPTPVHVIEKSAYDALTKERDELKSALKELDTKRWALLAELEAWRKQAKKLAEAVQACCDSRFDLPEKERVYYAGTPTSVICGRAFANYAAFKKERENK